jgi:hypothetical protein
MPRDRPPGDDRLALMRSRWFVVPTVALAGCGLLPNDPQPADGPPSRTECLEPLAFEGEATIAELGLVDAIPNIAGDATRRGMIRITRDVVTWEQFAPPNVPAAVPAGQLLCITFDDGTGMATLLHRPFGGVADGPVGEAFELPITPILVALTILLVVAMSWLAFRSRSRSDG